MEGIGVLSIRVVLDDLRQYHVWRLFGYHSLVVRVQGHLRGTRYFRREGPGTRKGTRSWGRVEWDTCTARGGPYPGERDRGGDTKRRASMCHRPKPNNLVPYRNVVPVIHCVLTRILMEFALPIRGLSGLRAVSMLGSHIIRFLYELVMKARTLRSGEMRGSRKRRTSQSENRERGDRFPIHAGRDGVGRRQSRWVYSALQS